ncbi:ATP-binding protein [Candidatus Parcubacteria bacterium]|nr:ATP-binding protein [Candidatus Parcubacteria bacterium]
MELLCPWEAPVNLIFSSNIPTLLYYSHFIAILAALIFALVLIPKIAESRPIRWFLVTIGFFTAWTVIDVLLWASNRPDVVLFYWNLQVLFEMLLFASAFYFAYTFITGQNLRFINQVLLSLLILPVIALLPTAHILVGIDASYCNALETDFLFYYVYAYEILLAFVTLFVAMRQLGRYPQRRGTVLFFTAGITIFLLAFASGNIVGSITEDWALAQIGLFGMPIFIGVLAYTAVRFKAFNLKLFAAQALVVALWLLTLSLLFIRTVENIRIVVAVNLILFAALGFLLIRSVKREIEQREHLEVLTKQLEAANERLRELDRLKSEFVSIASHQLRAPITAVQGYVSNMTDGSYGKVPKNLEEPLQTIREATRTMVGSIEDYLNISRIEQGRMRYEKSQFDIADLARKVEEEMAPVARKKNLTLSCVCSEPNVMVNADVGKIRQVLINIIDNAIKYTAEGSITIAVAKDSHGARITIADTGAGIPPEEIGGLFEKFKRARGANKINATGTGLGLYVAKQLVEGHGGTIRAESDGPGKGSRFIIELPLESSNGSRNY